MQVMQVSTESCSTLYQVDRWTVLLWIITGGQPCLSFEDYSFSQRFPIKDLRWTIGSEEWRIECRYPHQNPSHMQGPTYDVLPEGLKTLEDYVAGMAPLFELRNKRYNQLQFLMSHNTRIESARIHDKSNCTYIYFAADLQHNRFSDVSVLSSSYITRIDENSKKIAPDWWVRYAEFIIPIVESNRSSYEKLSEDEFMQMKSMLIEGLEGGFIKIV